MNDVADLVVSNLGMSKAYLKSPNTMDSAFMYARRKPQTRAPTQTKCGQPDFACGLVSMRVHRMGHSSGRIGLLA